MIKRVYSWNDKGLFYFFSVHHITHSNTLKCQFPFFRNRWFATKQRNQMTSFQWNFNAPNATFFAFLRFRIQFRPDEVQWYLHSQVEQWLCVQLYFHLVGVVNPASKPGNCSDYPLVILIHSQALSPNGCDSFSISPFSISLLIFDL